MKPGLPDIVEPQRKGCIAIGIEGQVNRRTGIAAAAVVAIYCCTANTHPVSGGTSSRVNALVGKLNVIGSGQGCFACQCRAVGSYRPELESSRSGTCHLGRHCDRRATSDIRHNQGARSKCRPTGIGRRAVPTHAAYARIGRGLSLAGKRQRHR